MVSRTCDTRVNNLSKLIYDQFYNETWFDDYFRIFYWSIRNLLERSKTKWMMFDTWCPTISTNNSWIDELRHKNYFYIGEKNINDYLKSKYKNIHNEYGYWNEQGHSKVCGLILEEYHKNYG